MKFLNFSEFLKEGLGILNTGTSGVGNVSTHDNIFTVNQRMKTKRKIKGSKINNLTQSDTQPPITDPGAYINRLLQ